MRIRVRSFAFVITIVAASLVAMGQARPAHGPFTAKDWAALHSAHAAAVSVNGTILYSVTYGAEKGQTHTDWWTIGGDGNNAKKLEIPDGFHPSGFTGDGQSLYGGWKVNDHQQFAVFALKDGKLASAPTIVVVLPRGVGSASPSPDGKRFAMTADPREPDPMDSVRHVQEPEETSLYVVNADGTGGAWWCKDLKYISGSITVGGGASAAAWSADSNSLAVLSQVPRIGHHEVGSTIDVCSASGTRHVTDIANSVSGIAWANGGKDLVFLSTKSLVLTPEHVWAVPAAGGTAEDRTPNLDATAVQIAGDAKGRIWVGVNRGVHSEVDEFRDGALKTAYRWPDGVVRGTPVESEYAGAGEQMAFTVGDPAHTTNVAVADGDHLRKITHEGDEQVAGIDLGPVEVVRWKSKEGIALEGIATFPAGYVKGKKYPFLVLPHGGPEANDELDFDPFSRTVAGLGYVVLQPEYRGSTGYGADFLAAIYQHFGDRAYEDVDSATDYAIAQGWADPNRPRNLRMECGRIHDIVDRDANKPIQGGYRGRGHHRLGPVPLDQRHSAGGLRCAMDGRGSSGIQQVFRSRFCEERDDAAADSAWRGGSARPYVPGDGVLSRFWRRAAKRCAW